MIPLGRRRKERKGEGREKEGRRKEKEGRREGGRRAARGSVDPPVEPLWAGSFSIIRLAGLTGNPIIDYWNANNRPEGGGKAAKAREGREGKGRPRRQRGLIRPVSSLCVGSAVEV